MKRYLTYTAMAVCVASPAYATEVSDIVDISPIIAALLTEIIGPIVIGGIGAAIGWAHYKLTGEKIDAQKRAYLEKGIQVFVSAAVARAKLKTQDLTDVRVKNDITREIAQQIVPSFAEAIKHFKLSDEQVRNMVERRLIPEITKDISI